jgi:hypothetical protein
LSLGVLRQEPEDPWFILADVTPDSVPVLAELLRSRDARNRELAAACLGDMGGAARPAVPALLAALSDPVDAVRELSRSALEDLDPGTLAAYDRDHPEEERQ